MKIYVLSASADSGKTTTLNHLAYYLHSLAPRYMLGRRVAVPPLPPSFVDCQYYFTATKHRTFRVGISTSGDNPGAIASGFGYFAQNNCDVGFIASRTFGKTVDELENQCRKIGATPQYCYLPFPSVTSRGAIQLRTVCFLESLIV